MELAHISAEYLIMPDGTEVKWMEAPAGRYFIADPDGDRWTVAVARVSTDQQDSLHQQIDHACRAASKDGNTVHAMYLEPGFSAFKLTFQQRVALFRLLEDIRAGTVKTIYVSSATECPARRKSGWDSSRRVSVTTWKSGLPVLANRRSVLASLVTCRRACSAV